MCYSRIPQHESISNDQGVCLQLRVGGPDGGPAVGGGEYRAVWRRPGADHPDGPGGPAIVYCILSLFYTPG